MTSSLYSQQQAGGANSTSTAHWMKTDCKLTDTFDFWPCACVKLYLGIKSDQRHTTVVLYAPDCKYMCNLHQCVYYYEFKPQQNW